MVLGPSIRNCACKARLDFELGPALRVVSAPVPMVPSATARPQPIAKQGKTSSNIIYLVATSMISAVPARTHFADGALVLRGAEKTYVGPLLRCL